MSSSSPPSYTTEDQLVKDDKQPRVTRRKSTREKEKTREGPGDLGSSRSDPSSVSRRKSRRHSSHLHDPQLPPEVIERIARQSIRSSKHINAELLRQIARAGGLPKDVEREDLPKFKVITGSEATRVYEKTLREDDRASSLSHDSSKRRVARHFETRPIVFAYPGIRAGRKVVDYYMTWKGKTPKAHRLKGAGRRTDILDGEFKNLSKTLDEYGKKVNKRLSALVSPDPSTPKASTFNPILPTKVDVDTLAEPTRPAAIQVESAPAVLTTTVPDDSDPLPPPRPPYARTNSNGSAVSLPTLGLPLVVVNPDARSSSSGQDSRRSSLAIGSPSKATKEKSPLTQVLTAVEEEQDDAKSTTSSKRQHGGHESQPHRHTSSKDRRERDSSRSPNSSTESLSDSSPSRHHHKKSDKDDEILIVLLDDKQASWHGLVGRRDSKKESISRKPSQRISPWSGPVANSRGEIHRFVPRGEAPPELDLQELDLHDPDNDDDDSDNTDDEDFRHAYDVDDSLIVSLKARLTALGLHSTTSTSTPRATTLPPYLLNSPYLHPTPASLGHISLHPSSPYSISAPNLPLSPQQANVYPSDSSSYVVPFVSNDPAASPWPLAPTPAGSMYASPYVPAAQIPYNPSAAGQYTPMSVSQPGPAASLYSQSPGAYVLSGSAGTGAMQMPLPQVSGYSSPYVDYATGVDYDDYGAGVGQATNVDLALYPLPPASYSSPYVPLRTQSPSPY